MPALLSWADKPLPALQPAPAEKNSLFQPAQQLAAPGQVVGGLLQPASLSASSTNEKTSPVKTLLSSAMPALPTLKLSPGILPSCLEQPPPLHKLSPVKISEQRLSPEPKFGQNKQLISFADLAMKSKSQPHLMDFGMKTAEKREKPPTKRQKISARLSLEQSNIEDTPVLIAMQASKEDAQPAGQSGAKATADNITELTYTHDKGSHHGAKSPAKSHEVPDLPKQENEEDSEGDEELPGSLKLLVGEQAAEEEKSRATRSRLHVDTIGLSSSTLGMNCKYGTFKKNLLPMEFLNYKT
jgi:hypothetical protein